tara:strand:- start:322 stop:498 length:177 start_codon:yes stop_codon:yes gene_type:complete
MVNKEILRRIAMLIVWAKHSKPGNDASAAPHDLNQNNILKIANELDSWLTENFHKYER